MPIGIILDVIERSLARPERIKHLEHKSSGTGADKTFPHRFVWEVVRDLLLGSALRPYSKTIGVEGRLTSRLNNTPPIGEPKATDIPEAAAAERTSLFRAA